MTSETPQEQVYDVWVLSRYGIPAETPKAARERMEGSDAYLRIPADMEVVCTGEKPTLIQVFGVDYGQEFTIEEEWIPRWDPNKDQDQLCSCGHPYHRHFDSYDEMKPIGCKYCPCSVPTLTEKYDIEGKYDKRPPIDLTLAKTVRAESIAADRAPIVVPTVPTFVPKIRVQRTGILSWWDRWREHRYWIREAKQRGFD